MRTITMHRLQELVRLHRLGNGAREVARLLEMSPNTERDYRLALNEAGLLAGDPALLPELGILRAAVEATRPAKPLALQQTSSVERWRTTIEALANDGASPTAIYDKLRTQHKADGFDGSLSAVKRLYARIRVDQGISPNDVAIPVDTNPGHVGQVDFGFVGKLWDPVTHALRDAFVFVLVLAYSRHQFAKLVFNQKVETWLALHVEAFEFFGSVVAVMVPDNLKAAVIRAAFDVRTEPVLNRSYRELARHYGFQIDPTPPYNPEKKGKVEAGVGYVKNNFMATIGEERDIDVLNPQLTRWVLEVAGQRKHGTTHKRPLEVFEQIERAKMLALPTVRWTAVSWRQPLLQRDCHALVEGARYSAPWRLIGKQLLARVSRKSVELYWEDTRVATHDRVPPGSRNTHDDHLPPERGEYRHRERSYWVEQAQAIGDEVESYVAEIFASDDVLCQLTKVQAIVRHLKNFPVSRARAACRRASFYGSYSYLAIKNILLKGLDLEPLPSLVVPTSSEHETPRFARNVQELLDFTTDPNDAPH
jgi:transposase